MQFQVIKYFFCVCYVVGLIFMKANPILFAGQTASLDQSPPHPGLSTSAQPFPKLGKSISRDLKGGETHVYLLPLSGEQVINAVIEQKGIDVVVTVFSPESAQVTRVDSPNGKQGPESVHFFAKLPGTYRIKVQSVEQTAPPGHYTAWLTKLSPATPQEVINFQIEQIKSEGTALEKTGTKGTFLQAIEKYKAALLLLKENHDLKQEAWFLNQIGFIYNALGDQKNALQFYQMALPVIRSNSDQTQEAVLLANIGTVYKMLGKPKEALDYYLQAQTLLKLTSDTLNQTVVLNNIGAVYSDLGRNEDALKAYQEVLVALQKGNNKQHEISVLSNIGGVYRNLGNLKAALNTYHQAVELLKNLPNNSALAAEVYSSLGTTCTDVGQKSQALEYLNLALTLRRAVGNRFGEGSTLNNLGHLFDSVGERETALQYYSQAASLRQLIGDKRGEAITLSNMSFCYMVQGEFQKAFDLNDQALELRRAVSDRRGEAIILANRGGLYQKLGNLQKAMECFQQALKVQQEVKDQIGEAASRYFIGYIHLLSNQFGQAVEQFQVSLKVFRSTGRQSGEAMILHYLGRSYLMSGDFQRAQDYFTQALTLARKEEDHNGEAIILHSLGSLTLALKQPDAALELYLQSLKLLQRVKNRREEANVSINMAVVERDRGNLNEARSWLDHALSLIEALRSEFTNTDFKMSFFSDQQNVYLKVINLLLEMHAINPKGGYLERAFQVSEQQKARQLVDFLAEARFNIRKDVNPELIKQEQQLQNQIAAAGQLCTKLLNRSQTTEQGQVLSGQVEELTTELERVQSIIRQQSPAYAALTQSQPISTESVQRQLLTPETVLLEFTLGTNQSYLWLVDQTQVSGYTLPGRSIIENAVSEFVSRISGKCASTVEEIDQANQRLSEVLFSQVSEKLGKKRLLIVPDGVLCSVPFGALFLPQSTSPTVKLPARIGDRNQSVPLVVRHEIVVLPSASTLLVTRQQTTTRHQAPKALAVFADPVFEKTDPRLVQSNQNSSGKRDQAAPQNVTTKQAPEVQLKEEVPPEFQLPRIIYAQSLENVIRSLVPPADRIIFQGFQANRSAITDVGLGQYRVIHFSTHGFVNQGQPALSGIILSLLDEQGLKQPGFLFSSDIYNLNLPVELVVLSACETGIGKLVKGEGMIGLTRAFMYAGSSRVISSLWKVADESTVELMKRFYQHLFSKTNPLPAAQALRAAQLEMLSGKNPKWRQPFHWAAFQLQGEYR